MADNETIRAKLRKIAALAERGVGGERDNAKSQLDRLLAKHGRFLRGVEMFNGWKITTEPTGPAPFAGSVCADLLYSVARRICEQGFNVFK